MNRIYFADKGHTRKANCVPLWPAKDADKMAVPEDFFEGTGLVCYIRPKMIYSSYYISEFSIYAKENMKKMYHANKYYGYINTPTLTAYIIKGHLVINTSIQGVIHKTPEILDGEWGCREMSIGLLREAVDLFTHYFPVQE